jgi:hypothetical protein
MPKTAMTEIQSLLGLGVKIQIPFKFDYEQHLNLFG